MQKRQRNKLGVGGVLDDGGEGDAATPMTLPHPHGIAV